MNADQEPVYPMMVVERMTGLTRRQIRYYEKHDLLRPARTLGGQRLFNRDEVNRLLLIKEIRQQGFHTLETVRRLIEVGWRSPTRKKGAKGGMMLEDRDNRYRHSDAPAYFNRYETVFKK